MKQLFSSFNLKRVFTFLSILAVLAVTISIYKENTTFDFSDGTHFLKKYYLPNAGSIKMKFKYECSHGKVIEEQKKLNQPEQAYDPSLQGRDDVSSFIAVEQEYKPIRIAVDFTNLSDTTIQTNSFIKKTILPAVVAFFEETVKVQRLTSPIIVDPFYKKKPCGEGKVIIPSHFTTGVPDADLLVYVRSFDDPKSTFAFAQSTYCPQAKGYGLESGRPTVIYLNINLNFMEEDLKSKDPMVFAKWIYIGIHEFTHSLAFSPGLFEKYLLEPNPVKKVEGKSVVVAPSLVKIGKEHFGCPTLTNLPLEDEGTTRSTSHHWERKAFGNEMMTGSPMYDSVFSSFTSAMFIASGWYKMNDQMLGTLTWGSNEKCDFLSKDCPSNSHEFCTASGNHCSYDFTGSGVCSDSDNLSNKCKYWKNYAEAHCNSPTPTYEKIFKKAGGGFGPTARCFESDLAKSAKIVGVTSLCFESKCEFSPKGNSIKFQVFDKEYTCDSNTKSVTIPSKGVVQCPDIDRFCNSSSACPNSCTGKGVCSQGKCKCYSGFKGDDCSAAN